MNDKEILLLLERCLDEVAPDWNQELSQLSGDIRFQDLAVDSVQIMEMVGVVEEECACQFADEDLAQIDKIGDMMELIKKVVA